MAQPHIKSGSDTPQSVIACVIGVLKEKTNNFTQDSVIDLYDKEVRCKFKDEVHTLEFIIFSSNLFDTSPVKFLSLLNQVIVQDFGLAEDKFKITIFNNTSLCFELVA